MDTIGSGTLVSWKLGSNKRRVFLFSRRLRQWCESYKAVSRNLKEGKGTGLRQCSLGKKKKIVLGWTMILSGTKVWEV